jgi:hypothetical protein
MRRSQRLVVPAFAAVIVASVASATPGCSVFTDLSTGGYALATSGDAGDAGTTTLASLCDGGKLNFSLACRSAADCNGSGECCLEPNGCDLMSACSVADCNIAPLVQICATDPECGAVPCLTQQCTIDGVSVLLGACVALPGCTVLTGSTSADAGVNLADAGSPATGASPH